jgi:hypothetical protein
MGRAAEYSSAPARRVAKIQFAVWSPDEIVRRRGGVLLTCHSEGTRLLKSRAHKPKEKASPSKEDS